jgi:ABC-type antimicrobial peptide transport system permease subunit
MSSTSFSFNDLLRRKSQTALVVLGLSLSVGSTLFLLLFSETVGLGLSLTIKGKLTTGFASLFAPFVLLLIVLIAVAGAVMVSFMASMMMSKRIRDIGLMKAAGCPNDLVFGYFFTELVVVSFLGSLLGVFLGLLAEYVSTIIFGVYGLEGSKVSFNPWIILFVFVFFFLLPLIAGVKPILDASRVKPVQAISPSYYFGLSKESGSKVLSRSGLTLKLALRSLIRHKSSTVKVVLSLSIVFTLITVGVAGGLIASQTTIGWVERATGKNMVLMAHKNVCEQYTKLLKEFTNGNLDLQFNYTSDNYGITSGLLDQLRVMPGVTGVDPRLILRTTALEIQGISLGETSGQSTIVGDSRKADTLIIGIEPHEVLGNWKLRGSFLRSDDALEVVLGDTLSTEMFSDPLVQKMKVFETALNVVGICIDPINNGKVAYTPIRVLQRMSGISKPNVALISLNPSLDRAELLTQLQTLIHAGNQEYAILDLDSLVKEAIAFLRFIWSSVLVIPFFAMGSASLCLIGYVVLTMEDQLPELGVLRAVGARPNTIFGIVSEQSLLILLSSYGIGVGFGTIITLLILMNEPTITVLTVLEIGGWLAIALTVTLLSSLYPVLRFRKKPLLEMIRKS